MKAKTVNENIDFQRGGSAKRSIGIGVEAKKDSIREFLDWIAKDEQLDTNHENYMGFVNVAEDFIQNKELNDGFMLFVEMWDKDSAWIETYMRSIGLDVENEPDLDETIFIHGR